MLARQTAACLFLIAVPLLAFTAGPALSVASDPLQDMSQALQALTHKVSPAVVKILVTGYGPVRKGEGRTAAAIGRQRAIGSGVIVDANGCVITNAHVISGAQTIRVVLAKPEPGPSATPPPKERILPAKVVGQDKATDLAVLKIEAAGLPVLAIGDYRSLRQGQLVLAFGSPEGLENTVTMGVVSSPMRQPDPDRPMIYVQTDAAINPGNSGGPLVDISGNVVGINTFILSESGGNEGIGFAIPSMIVRFVYGEILAHGHVHQRRIGAHLQAVTPALAEGLRLSQSWGVLVADVLPEGPAEAAGLRIGDLIVRVDGTVADGLPAYQAAIYRKAHNEPVSLEVVRDARKLAFKIPVTEQQQSQLDDVADLVDPDKNLVPDLGILGVEITHEMAARVGDLRRDSGVLVAAMAADSSVDTGLEPGDVIHALNGADVTTLDGLRSALKSLKPGDSVALQVERDGLLSFLSFHLGD